MDFNELKFQYKKRIEEISRKRDELFHELERSHEETDKLILIYKNAISLVDDIIKKQPTSNELGDYLKLHGFENIPQIDAECERSMKNSGDVSRRIEQIDEEIYKTFLVCPNCKGEGRIKEVVDRVNLGGSMEIIWRYLKCNLCGGKGSIPVNELLDC